MKNEIHYWLMKSEPSSFSINDLANKINKIEPWNGVRNYQARNFLRSMQLNDRAFFYHSSCQKPGIVGIVKIVRTAYPDETALDPTDPHFDPKSSLDKMRWFCVDMQLIQKFKHLISLETLKKQAQLSSMHLLKKGNRLSVMPISVQEWETILQLVKIMNLTEKRPQTKII
jgi:predicted RNA-binding protein with PUA-like domain